MLQIIIISKYIQIESMILHKGAIAAMIHKGKGSDQNYAVQCSKVKIHSPQTVVVNIFDGEQNCKGIIQIQSTKKSMDRYVGSKEPFRIVITSFTIYTAENKRKNQSAIVILCFQFLQVHLIKKEQYDSSLPKLEDGFKNIKKQHKRIQSNMKPIKIQTHQHTISNNTTKRKQKLKLLFSQEQNQETAAQVPKDIEIRDFEKISDLYPNLYGWQIIVRVIDKSYRNFLSKQNRQIQILNIHCIDRTSTMIEATCFAEQATHLNNTIKLGGVYRVARCRIVEEEYNKKKSSRYSKYSLKIVTDSSIIAVQDFPEIPYDSKNYSMLCEITESMDMSQLYSFVGILSRIDAERTILKADKEIIMQSFKIHDPNIDRAIEGFIWNRQLKLDQDLLNKSIMLKHVKVSKYKDAMTLNVTFKSQIVPHLIFIDNPETCNLKLSFEDYSRKNIKKLADLSIELKHFDKEPIVSEIYIWVNSVILGSKWYYESCPNCKKTATPFSTCINCSHHVEECIKRFLVTIELCDDTGSIYVTAFEDTASIFLKHAKLQDLLMMDQVERKAYGDGCAYECYWLKINSKKDGNGRINHHIMGRPQVCDAAMQSKMNLNVIRNQIEHLNIINISS